MEFKAEIKKTFTGPDKLRAVCSVVLDDCFLVKGEECAGRRGRKGAVCVPAQPPECQGRVGGALLPYDEGAAGEALRCRAGSV